MFFPLQNLTFGAFLYPDFETAIVGHFSGRLLSRGYEARVTGMSCSEAGLPILQFERQDDSEEASYRYDPPNHYHFGDDPTLADPYESKNVEVSHCSWQAFTSRVLFTSIVRVAYKNYKFFSRII